jgi:hypothetical protein
MRIFSSSPYSSKPSIKPRFGARPPKSLIETHGQDEAQRIAPYLEHLIQQNPHQRSKDMVILANRGLGVLPAISKQHIRDMRDQLHSSDTLPPSPRAMNPFLAPVAEPLEAGRSSQQKAFTYNLGGYEDYLDEAGRQENLQKDSKAYAAARNARTNRRRTAIRQAMSEEEKRQIRDAVEQTYEYKQARTNTDRKNIYNKAIKRRLNEIIKEKFYN